MIAARLAVLSLAAATLAGCVGMSDLAGLGSAAGRVSDYSSLPSSGHLVASATGTTIPDALLDARRQGMKIGVPRGTSVAYAGSEPAGTIVIEQSRHSLYFVEGDGKAIRYTVAIGKVENQWAGISRVLAVHLQPGWTPPESMRRPGADPGAMIPSGAPNNPMGIGALTLAGGDYAIHGTNRPDTIGRAVSGGCFRMLNEDIADLMRRVRVGTRVVVNR
ncbi:MAG: L,D-transpeptidase [Hyphomicrobiales bacterium]|nr:L,D-transpeptidase [Hyphomicrobiales bacterium]